VASQSECYRKKVQDFEHRQHPTSTHSSCCYQGPFAYIIGSLQQASGLFPALPILKGGFLSLLRCSLTTHHESWDNGPSYQGRNGNSRSMPCTSLSTTAICKRCSEEADTDDMHYSDPTITAAKSHKINHYSIWYFTEEGKFLWSYGCLAGY
jgi:hypothetical protein